MKKLLKIALFLLLYLLVARSSSALTPNISGYGTVTNVNATGSFSVSINKTDIVSLSGLRDMAIVESNAGNADRTDVAAVCYFATTSKYLVDMDTGTDFNMPNSVNPNQKIKYELWWTDKSAAVTTKFISNASTMASAISYNQSAINCSGGSNAEITFFIEAQEYKGMGTGLYSDTVTITISGQ